MGKLRPSDIFDIGNDDLGRMLAPDPGIKPGGIREQALEAVRERGPQRENKEKTKASQAYWAKYRASKNARGDDDGEVP